MILNNFCLFFPASSCLPLIHPNCFFWEVQKNYFFNWVRIEIANQINTYTVFRRLNHNQATNYQDFFSFALFISEI